LIREKRKGGVRGRKSKGKKKIDCIIGENCENKKTERTPPGGIVNCPRGRIRKTSGKKWGGSAKGERGEATSSIVHCQPHKNGSLICRPRGTTSYHGGKRNWLEGGDQQKKRGGGGGESQISDFGPQSGGFVRVASFKGSKGVFLSNHDLGPKAKNRKAFVGVDRGTRV